MVSRLALVAAVSALSDPQGDYGPYDSGPIWWTRLAYRLGLHA